MAVVVVLVLPKKPLGRTVRLFRCVHALMVKLGVERQDGPGGRARAWLEWVATSPRRLLTTAMLADAADEAMALLRYCDTEQMDVASLSDNICEFLARVTHLFGQRRACLTTVGYTLYCLHTLREPLVWAMRGRMYSITTPTDADIEFCLGHMRSWLKLADAELRCEFPDFEVAQAAPVQPNASLALLLSL